MVDFPSFSTLPNKGKPTIAAVKLAQAQQWEQADKVWNEAEAVIRTIGEDSERAEAWHTLGIALFSARQWERARSVWNEAEAVIHSIDDDWLRDLAWQRLISVQQWERARTVLD